MSLAAPLPSSPRIPEPASSDITYGAPYTYLAPTEDRLPLIFASPHSGQHYPDSLRTALCVPLIDLQRTEDAFVDDLFSSAAGRGAGLLTARYARTFVDLNRDPLELDRRMFDGPPPRRCGIPGPRVEAGLGCLPKVGARGQGFYSTQLDPAEAEARLRDVHDAYHRHLSGELARLKELHEMAFLVDCHSMPSRQPSRRPLAEIVLGDRFGSSCGGRLTSLIEKRFRKLGYSVARNAPYAGGYTTLRYGRPLRGLHAIQIEIRRDLYMDEVRVQRSAGYSQLSRDIGEVVADVAAFVKRQLTRA